MISYYGEKYVGWQKQLNGLSVQEVMEKALTKVFEEETQCTASGRTDAGVHAEGQVIHFDANTSIPTDKIPFAVNTYLPDDVSMLYCEETLDDFNARFAAKRKTYCYKIYVSPHKRPMYENTHEHIVVPLDINLIKDAAKLIEGEHDFKCFEASGSVIKNTVRTIYEIKIEVDKLPGVLSLEQESKTSNLIDSNGLISNAEICISVTGNGFLYNMVRIIAGTLVYVGLHKLTLDDVKDILESGDRKKAGKTLAAKGLHLISVVY